MRQSPIASERSARSGQALRIAAMLIAVMAVVLVSSTALALDKANHDALRQGGFPP